MHESHRIHPLDNVAVAMEPIAKGETITLEDGVCVTALQDIQRGHKIALIALSAGEPIRKYGCVIGLAKAQIAPGEWVHTHNVRTGLSEEGDYVYRHKAFALPPVSPRTFQGFRRADGRCRHPQRNLDSSHRRMRQFHCPAAGSGKPAPGFRQRGGTLYLPPIPSGAARWETTTHRRDGFWRHLPAIPTPGACWYWGLAARI